MCMAVVGLLGAVVSGIGAAAQASATSAGHEADAQMQRRQAVLETEQGGYEARQQQRQVDRALGSQRANYAASGLALTGTPGDVIEESAQEGAMDVMAIRWGSGLRAENARYSAKVSDMNARSARRAAPIAFLSPVLSGVARFGSDFSMAG